MLKYEVFYRDEQGVVDSFTIEEETVEDVVRTVNHAMIRNNWKYLYLNWLEGVTD